MTETERQALYLALGAIAANGLIAHPGDDEGGCVRLVVHVTCFFAAVIMMARLLWFA